MTLRLTLSLKSFEPKLLDKCTQKIQYLRHKLQGPGQSPSELFYVSSPPTKVKKFTVLRSPHIDKKSREQFEMRFFKKHVHFVGFLSLLELHFFVDLLKNFTFVGVQSKIRLTTYTTIL